MFLFIPLPTSATPHLCRISHLRLSLAGIFPALPRICCFFFPHTHAACTPRVCALGAPTHSLFARTFLVFTDSTFPLCRATRRHFPCSDLVTYSPDSRFMSVSWILPAERLASHPYSSAPSSSPQVCFPLEWGELVFCAYWVFLVDLLRGHGVSERFLRDVPFRVEVGIIAWCQVFGGVRQIGLYRRLAFIEFS